MKKEMFIKLAAVAMTIMLALSLINTFRLGRELSQLRRQLSNLEHNIISDISQQNASVQHQSRQDIRQILQEEQSLFTDTSVELELIDGQLAVKMAALPKEISHDEQLYARIFANGKTHEKAMDASDEAVIKMDFTQTISPAFIIRSDQGIRQEKLPDIDIKERLSFHAHSEWSEDIARIEDQAILNLWLVDSQDDAILSKADIEKAEFILVDLDQLYGTDHSDEPVRAEYRSSDIIMDLMGQEDSDVIIRVPAELIQISPMTYDSKGRFHYQADLKDMVSQHEGSAFDIHFMVTTRKGMRFVNFNNPVAQIHMSDRYMHAGSGSERLVPILD